MNPTMKRLLRPTLQPIATPVPALPPSLAPTRLACAAVLLLSCILTGCGTTHWTDTRRSGTEQMLLSDAMDRAVNRLDFNVLAGKSVYVDTSPLSGVTDAAYLESSIRQHLLASGGLLREKQDEADYVIEVRAGAVGTDRDEVLYGIPAVNIPASIPIQGSFAGQVPQIPEIPFVKKTRQNAVAKIALFAYNRKTGRPVWQSGIVPVESKVKNWWVFGAGPIQRGAIYDGTQFAGESVKVPQIDLGFGRSAEARDLTVFDEAVFPEIPEAREAVASDKDGPAKEKEPTSQAQRPGRTLSSAPPQRPTANPSNRNMPPRLPGGTPQPATGTPPVARAIQPPLQQPAPTHHPPAPPVGAPLFTPPDGTPPSGTAPDPWRRDPSTGDYSLDEQNHEEQDLAETDHAVVQAGAIETVQETPSDTACESGQTIEDVQSNVVTDASSTESALIQPPKELASTQNAGSPLETGEDVPTEQEKAEDVNTPWPPARPDWLP